MSSLLKAFVFAIAFCLVGFTVDVWAKSEKKLPHAILTTAGNDRHLEVGYPALGLSSNGTIQMYASSGRQIEDASSQVSSTADVDSYITDMARRVKRAWFPPKNMEVLTVKIGFVACHDGHVEHLRVLASSGFPLADQAALKAVVAAAPFQGWPEIKDESVPIIFTFDSNLFNAVDNAKVSNGGISMALVNPIKAAFSGSVFESYLADSQRRIRRQWYPPKISGIRPIKLAFRLHKDGRVSDLRIITSSGISIADRAALMAIKNASPLGCLPGWAADDLEIDYIFDYSRYSGGHAQFRSF